MRTGFLAIVNRAAGFGKCGKLVDPALSNLRSAGVTFEVAETRYQGHGTELVKQAYAAGYRRFLAVGGDGTSFEIVNGLFPGAEIGEPPTLGFLPLGTGNSFLRDFTRRGLEYATQSLIEGRTRPCDVLRMTHRDGVIHYINLLSVGFVADVAVIANRRFKRYGELGYLLGVVVCLARLDRRAFPMRIDGGKQVDRRRCLLLTFNNSKFTGGKMMLAPNADTADGLIEYVRWGPVGRAKLVSNLPGLYSGEHIKKPQASRRGVRRVDFELSGPVDVMVDGEVMTIHCERLEVLPSALKVVA